jgi:hypothetical protein
MQPMNTNSLSRLKRGGVLALIACLPIAGHGAGVLAVSAKVVPERISPGDKATLSIESRDGFQRPLSGVMVKITADTGYFESNHGKTVQGITNESGVFNALWQSDSRTAIGPQEFNVLASRNGYIGRYPITTKVFIEGQFERKFDLPGKPPGPGESDDGASGGPPRPYLPYPGPPR